MNAAIIISTKDLAGMNIKDRLLKKFVKTDLVFDDHPVFSYRNRTTDAYLFTTDKDSIDCEHIDEEIKKITGTDTGLVIFATKHQSASGIHSLSVHSPGNWGKAEYGGEDDRLCIAPSALLKFSFMRLQEEKDRRHLDYEVIQECTHHGPYIETQTIFIEIGSDEDSWQNPVAGEAIADTLLYLLDNLDNIPRYRSAFGIGGLHHTPSFTNVTCRTDIAFGHVCPKYMLSELTKDKIMQAIERTQPKAGVIILDWKGLGNEKERIKQMLDELDMKYEKTHSLQK